MRSALAVLTAVAFLANAPLANAAGASPTTAVAGYCPWWSTEPALLDLGDIVDDADCTSAAAVVLDPHVVTNVVVLPEYTGPRAMGAPSGERTIADVRWSDPYVTSDAPGERILLLDAYDSYKDGLASWRATTQIASEAAGSAHAEWFSVGPTWMRSANGASTATVGIIGGDLLSNAAATTLFPFIGVAAFLPAVESFAREVRDAPAHLGSGASEAWTGARAGRFDQTAEGVAEVCGGVGVLASVAVPFAKGTGAIRTTPVTLFPKGVPVVKAPAPVMRAIVSESKLGYLFGRASGNSHNITRAAENAAQLERIGIQENAAGRALLQQHFDETVATPANVTSTYTNEWGTFQTRDSLLIGPRGFVKLETTWQVMSESELRMTTALPFGGS